MSNSNIQSQIVVQNRYKFDGVYEVVATSKDEASLLIYEDLGILLPSKQIQKRIRFMKIN
jgi:hypothetical protein